MARRCKVCDSQHAADINRALASGEPLTDLSRRFGITTQAISRHKRNHLRLLSNVGSGRVAAAPEDVKPLQVVPEAERDALLDTFRNNPMRMEDITPDYIITKQANVLRRFEELCDRFDAGDDKRGLLEGLKACAGQIKELGVSSGAIQQGPVVQVGVSVSIQDVSSSIDVMLGQNLDRAPTEVRRWFSENMLVQKS
jgi:hypothetical protein